MSRPGEFFVERVKDASFKLSLRVRRRFCYNDSVGALPRVSDLLCASDRFSFP